ncbi:MAG: hypothetical protein ACRCSY_01595, partial [Cetobacterium sp.]
MLGLKYPLCKELIDKMSNKWQKRTQDMITKWPKEGTFDVTLCEEMETLIKNYKIKSSLKKKKRENKREKEKAVLALFRKEGEELLKNIKQARKMIKEVDKETMKKEEIFANAMSIVAPEGQFPILKGMV